MARYPYDPDIRAYVARLLHEALPAMLREQDRRPQARDDWSLPEPGHLERFLRVLAAPHALVRQNIEELHADLFIDTANDWVIPYLAQMVGTTLVFPDADSNRRDVRGTVGWRRRKGTPAALQEMGTELTGQLVVTQEGWKRLNLFQDLDMLRRDRVVPDLRSPLIAEQSTGPLDATAHAVDLRAIGRSTGRHHPKHVVHWLHATLTFPLRGATCVEETALDTDVRFAMHPLGERHPLRARRTEPHDRLATDRIPEQHFAARPDNWFGVDGRFAVRICGLLAGVAAPGLPARSASTHVASLEVAQGGSTLTLLEHESRRMRGPVRIELGVAPCSFGSDEWRPNTAAFVLRAILHLDANGTLPTPPVAPSVLPPQPAVVMLRVLPLGGASGRHFPGATVVAGGGRLAAGAASQHDELAREGVLHGAFVVAVPRLQIHGERWLLLAADGSLYDAQDAAGLVRWHPQDGGALRLGGGALAVSPGPAWPVLAQSAEPSMALRVPSAPGRGPVVMHGGWALRRPSTAWSFATVSSATRCALVFALRIEAIGGPIYHPFQALRWTGPDPSAATWVALVEDGQPATAAASAARYETIARLRDDAGVAGGLAVRFLCEDPQANLAPAEVAWTADDGGVVLVHLPQLAVMPVSDSPRWPVEPVYPYASEAIRVATDGSTWAGDSTANRRRAVGAVAPLRSIQATPLLRREVRWRRLCAWDNEAPPQRLAFTDPRRLDVDVAHGLFAMHAQEPPQAWSADASGRVPPSVTADFEDGATMHIGARPAAREPELDLALPRPTRLVSRSGHLHEGAPASWHAIPRYPSLADALAAIDYAWQSLTPADIDGFAERDEVALDEVVQLEDSATYPDGIPRWPAAPLDPAVAVKARLSLTIQAAETERPVVRLAAGVAPLIPTATRYHRIVLRGIALGGVGNAGIVLPSTRAVVLELCTVLYADDVLRLPDPGFATTVEVVRSELGGLVLDGAGTIEVRDGIVEADSNALAIEAPLGHVVLERVTVGGQVSVGSISASETIFDDRVQVTDRFHGCVRYCRVTADSVLPRKHRVTVDTPVRYVSLNRHAAGWRRLRSDCDDAVRRGAENGSEMGAFSVVRLAERTDAFARRLVEHTPAGLVTGIIRVD